MFETKTLTEHYNKYVTDSQNSETIINDTIEALNNFLDKRFELDDYIIKMTSPFVTL